MFKQALGGNMNPQDQMISIMVFLIVGILAMIIYDAVKH